MRANCISRQSWARFTAGELETIDQVAEHCQSCAACTRLRDALQALDQSLAAKALALIESAAPPRSTLTRIRDGITFRIRRQHMLRDQPDAFAAEVDFELLRSILIPMCGPEIAEFALTRAGNPGASPFASSLGNMIDVICGETAARLVEQTAQPQPGELG